MKKLFFTIIALALFSGVFAQTPDAFKYQAVAHGASGNVLQNQNVSLRISIQQGVAHNDVYVETHDATTNAFGLFNLEIGNGTVVSGDFNTIDWSLGSYYIQIEMDENGGSNYQLMGVSPLLSVPYAMHAKTADNVFSGNYNDLTNTPDLSNYDSNVSDDFSGNYSDLNGAPTLSTVATSGSYNDLSHKPVLAGDVTGATNNNKVEKIQGLSVSASVPANGQILKWNATTQIWEPSEDALGAAGTTDGVVTSGSITGTAAKTLTLTRSNGLGDIVITFNDEVNDADADPGNELQALTLSGTNLSISNGNTIDLGVIQDGTGTDSQHLTLIGTVLSIDNGNSVDLATLLGSIDTDDQTLTLNGNILSIADGNSVDLSAFMDNTDTHLTEAQVDAYVSNNGYLTSEVDGSVTNEIQDLSLSGNTLSLSGDATTVNLAPYMDNTDAQTLSLSGTTLAITGGNSVNLSSIDTRLTEAQVDAYVSNNGYLTSFTEVDGSVTNEIQDLSLSGNTLSLSGDATTVNLAPYMDNTDAQTLSLSGTTLAITGGNSVNLSSIDTRLTEAQVDTYVSNNGYLTSEVDGSTTNELQTLALSGSTLSISSGNSVDLSSLGGGSDSQTLSLSGTTLSITGGNSVNLSSIDTRLTEAQVDTYVSNNGYLTSEVDGSTTNELQTISLSGNYLTISNGNTIDISSIDTKLTEAQVDAYVSNNGFLTSFTEMDGSVTNELQNLGLTGSILTISGGNAVDLSGIGGSDSQTLSLSGTTLSITGGNSVDLSSIDTRLTEAQVDAYVSNNGYLTSFTEVDGSTTNELQTLSLSGSNLTISSGNTVSLSSLAGTDDQTLSEVLTQGTDAGNKNITNVAKLGVGTSSVNTCAAAEVNSTTGGVLLPRMTTTQRDAITLPLPGLMIFNTTSSKFQGYTGTPTVVNYAQQTMNTQTQATSTLEQTFIPTLSGTVNKIDLHLNTGSSGSDVVARLYQGTTLLGTSEIVTIGASQFNWFSFNFGGIPITSGTTYKIMLVPAVGANVYWQSSSTNVSTGEAYINSVAQTFDFTYWVYITTGGGWVNLH